MLDFSKANFTVLGSRGWNGDARVAEVLIYDRALGDGELKQLENDLAARYSAE